MSTAPADDHEARLRRLEESLRGACRHGLKVMVNIILFPDDTRRDVIDTFKFMLRCSWLGLHDIAFVPYVRLAIGYAGADNFTGAALPGYGAPAAWLHPSAADGLAQAALELAEAGLAIVVFDAYRPRRASVAMVEWARASDRTDLLRDGFVAARSQHNRGLAISDGKLILPANDARLIALDAMSGKELWQSKVADINQYYSLTIAPRIAGDKVVIGVAGGEYFIRGFFAAYNLKDGSLAWKFHTVPPAPGKPGPSARAGRSGARRRRRARAERGSP